MAAYFRAACFRRPFLQSVIAILAFGALGDLGGLALAQTSAPSTPSSTRAAPAKPESGKPETGKNDAKADTDKKTNMKADNPASEAVRQSAVKAKYGDWEMRCDRPPGAAADQCALLQSVAAEDRSNITLIVIVLKTADGKNRLLRIIAPLGVLLPNGLGLKIDDADIGRAGFVRCVPSGCVAEVIMEEKLIEQMRAGKTATFIIYQTPEEGVGIPLSLAGFPKGFDALP